MEEFVQAAIQKHNFMGAVLVARGDEILLNKGYGQANVDPKGDELAIRK